VGDIVRQFGTGCYRPRALDGVGVIPHWNAARMVKGLKPVPEGHGSRRAEQMALKQDGVGLPIW